MKFTPIILLFLLIFSDSSFDLPDRQGNDRSFYVSPINYPDPDRSHESPFSGYGGKHNCRMWAALSNDFEDSLIIRNLVTYPNSLKNLSQSANTDGWGIGHYQPFGDSLIIERSALQAYYDPVFDSTVSNIEISAPNIVLAHIRYCSSGCCCHDCETIINPHPFWRYKNGKYWSFVHNGHLDKALLLNLMGEDYLIQNPPSGSGIPECDPSDTSLIVDSELYFLLLLMHIEANNWNAGDGIIEALSEIIINNPQAYMNFILSDGESLWGFRRGQSLYYLDESVSGYRALASQYPPLLQGNWVRLNDYDLVFFNADDSVTVMDIRPFLPPDFYIAGDSNGDLEFNELDITYSVNYLKGIGPAPVDTIDCWPKGLLMAAADVNGSCAFNGLDIIYSVSYFSGFGPYPRPCPDCPPAH